MVLCLWDESEFAWKAESWVSISEKEITGTINQCGQYAFLHKDKAPIVPGPVIIGEKLPGVGQELRGTLPAGISARVEFFPAMIVPGQTAEARFTIDTPTAISSGTPIQADVYENYNLLTGSNLSYTPYTGDLTIFNYGDGGKVGNDGVMRYRAQTVFNVGNNSQVQMGQIQQGTIKLNMMLFRSQLPVVIGPEGGTATGEGGAEIVIPAGAVSAESPVAVTLKKIDPADHVLSAAISLPTGFEAIAGMDLSLGGNRLTQPAVVSLPLSEEQVNAIPGEAQLFIVKLEKLEAELCWIWKGRAVIEGERIKSLIETGNTLPFPGVKEGGIYIFLRAIVAGGVYKRGSQS